VTTETDTKIHLHQKPPKADDEIDITPMIDVVFLLLFFFMVTSKIDRQSPVEMPQAVHGVDVIPRKTVIVTAKLAPGGETTLYLGDGISEDKALAGELIDQEEQIRKYIEQEIAQRPDVTGIMLKADAKVRQRYVAVFGRAAAAAGGGRPMYFGVEEE
jgi:biopolymer transport protein ExbD